MKLGLNVHSITKRYGATIALDNVSFGIGPGEVHALCGENGAGKSTLIQALAGAIQPDEGEITIRGQKVYLSSPRESQDRGIRVIHQELHLVPELSVTDNLFLGRPLRRSAIFLDRKMMKSESRKILERVGLEELDLSLRVGDLRAGERQLVAIAKELASEPRFLIMDEPTASLAEKDTDRLVELVRQLASQGIGILFVSHHLAEVFAVADRITVIRDGRILSTKMPSDTNKSMVAEEMTGRQLAEGIDFINSRTVATSPFRDTVLTVKRITRSREYSDVSFTVAKGECVALVGLVGAGRTEVLRTLAGVALPESGSVSIEDKVAVDKRKSRIPSGVVAFVPESRKTEGLFSDASVEHNISVRSLPRLSNFGFISRRAEKANASHWVARLRVKTPSLNAPINYLSGGNQQKSILARWLSADSEIFLLDEPTHGVDVGAKAEIRALVEELKFKDKAVVLVSSDVDEVMALSDKVVFLRGGKVASIEETARLTRADVTHRLLSANGK